MAKNNVTRVYDGVFMFKIDIPNKKTETFVLKYDKNKYSSRLNLLKGLLKVVEDFNKFKSSDMIDKYNIDVSSIMNNCPDSVLEKNGFSRTTVDTIEYSEGYYPRNGYSVVSLFDTIAGNIADIENAIEDESSENKDSARRYIVRRGSYNYNRRYRTQYLNSDYNEDCDEEDCDEDDSEN